MFKPNKIISYSQFLNKHFYNNTLQSVEKALTINPLVYHDKNYFKLEKEKIFKNSWIPLGYTNQFKNNINILPTQIHNIPIILTKEKNNIKGYYNICRHRGCKLVSKESNKKSIVCPYHNWSYTLKGDLINTPLYKPKREDFHKANYSLFPINIEILNNIIFGNISKTPSNINEDFGNIFKLIENYALDKCHIVKEKKYVIDCNWKLLIDNFIEYYHLPYIHKDLTKISKVKNHICTQNEGLYISFKTDPITTRENILDITQMKPFSNIKSNELNLAHFIMLFPNMFIFLFPNHIFSVIIEPIGPKKSIEHSVLLIENEENKHLINNLWNFYDKVNQEDINICEKVQEGLNCEIYEGGRMVPEYESTIHRFHKMIIDKITK